jgi:hypothetical protein
LRGVARLIYGLTVVALTPVAGIFYHFYKAITQHNSSESDALNKARFWSHLKAAGIDLATATVSITTLFFAYKAALALPTILKDMGQFRNLPLNLENQMAYQVLMERFFIASFAVTLPLIAPIAFAWKPNEFKALAL